MSYYDSTFGAGERKGLQEGMKKEMAIETARLMLQHGLPTNTITKCTGLFTDQISNLGA